jgi:hypothetical protein
MEGKKVAGRPRTKLLDWMICETDSRTYEDLKNWCWTEDDGERGISDLSKDRKRKKNLVVIKLGITSVQLLVCQ